MDWSPSQFYVWLALMAPLRSDARRSHVAPLSPACETRIGRAWLPLQRRFNGHCRSTPNLIAERYIRFADHVARGRSPLYEALAQGVADTRR